MNFVFGFDEIQSPLVDQLDLSFEFVSSLFVLGSAPRKRTKLSREPVNPLDLLLHLLAHGQQDVGRNHSRNSVHCDLFEDLQRDFVRDLLAS